MVVGKRLNSKIAFLSAIYRPIENNAILFLTAISDTETELQTGSRSHLSKTQDKSTISHNTPKVPSPDVTGNVVPDLESTTHLSAVKETVPEIVSEVPEIVPEVAEIVADVPNIVSHVPVIVPEVPVIVMFQRQS
jgi:hypothetical protein